MIKIMKMMMMKMMTRMMMIVMTLMYEQGKESYQMCRDGSRNSSLRSVVRSYHYLG